MGFLLSVRLSLTLVAVVKRRLIPYAVGLDGARSRFIILEVEDGSWEDGACYLFGFLIRRCSEF